MPVLPSSLLISVSAVLLLLDQVVRRRFRAIKSEMPAAYDAVTTNNAAMLETSEQRLAGDALMPLAVDLMRGCHGTIDYDALTDKEQRMILFAHAINRLPGWMVRYSALFLSSTDRALVLKLRQIHASRPTPKVQYFGNIRMLRRLRSPHKT